MKRLSDEDSLINQQAATVAASVLSETVEAATRCEQLTRATRAEAHGIGRVSRFFMRVDDAAPAVSGLGQEGKYLRAAGLPNSFILAVTAGSVYALEDKRDRGYVVPGQVLRSWVRGGFRASLDPAALQRAEGGVRRSPAPDSVPAYRGRKQPLSEGGSAEHGWTRIQAAQVHGRSGRSEPARDRRVRRHGHKRHHLLRPEWPAQKNRRYTHRRPDGPVEQAGGASRPRCADRRGVRRSKGEDPGRELAQRGHKTQRKIRNPS